LIYLSAGRFNAVVMLPLMALAWPLGMAVAAEPVAIGNHVVIDGEKIPYGKTIEVIGLCLDSSPASDGPGLYAASTLKVLRIDGRPYQENFLFASARKAT